MKIALNSVFVDDQDKAQHFYTEVLGFVQQHDIPAGDYRWITVASPEAPEGAALLLAPNNEAAWMRRRGKRVAYARAPAHRDIFRSCRVGAVGCYRQKASPQQKARMKVDRVCA